MVASLSLVVAMWTFDRLGCEPLGCRAGKNNVDVKRKAQQEKEQKLAPQSATRTGAKASASLYKRSNKNYDLSIDGSSKWMFEGRSSCKY